jgi:sugar-specific transcriptional regulator TrmB
MTTDLSDDPRSAAIEQLEQFGLSAYAARTFVALMSLGTGTAKDVSGISDVPRTRVYDATDELQELGLVDVQQSSPKEFWAISTDTAARKFEREMDHRLSTLTTALDELEPARRSEKQRGVWTVEGQATITDRVVEFVEGAEDELHHAVGNRQIGRAHV